MNPTPLVVIVMPAFNSGHYIAAAIESVVSQSYTNWELVIVDDGSTDSTGRVADQFAMNDPSRIRVIHQENSGIAGARNRALAEANPASEFTAFLDHDDVWYPETLAKMVSAIGTDKTVVGVHGFRTYIDKNGKQIAVDGSFYAPVRRRAVHKGRLRTVTESEPTTFECLAYGCCVFTGAMLVRTEAIRIAGFFDPEAVLADDWDMWLRLSLQGSFEFLREPLYGYRLHGTNSSGNATRKNNCLYYVRHKFVSDSRLSAATRATMMAGFRWYEVYRASVCFRQVVRRVKSGTGRDVSTIGLSGLRHLWTSVLPGARRLQLLGAKSGDRTRG
ncbi:MAG: glycosyltransferase [Gemmatimonadaceae bacterium]